MDFMRVKCVLKVEKEGVPTVVRTRRVSRKPVGWDVSLKGVVEVW